MSSRGIGTGSGGWSSICCCAEAGTSLRSEGIYRFCRRGLAGGQRAPSPAPGGGTGVHARAAGDAAGRVPGDGAGGQFAEPDPGATAHGIRCPRDRSGTRCGWSCTRPNSKVFLGREYLFTVPRGPRPARPRGGLSARDRTAAAQAGGLPPVSAPGGALSQPDLSGGV